MELVDQAVGPSVRSVS